MRGMRRPPVAIAGFLLLFLLVGGFAGCATRQSVDGLQREVNRLQQQNFQLRKDLAEARVRMQMQAERDTAGPPEAEAEAPLDPPRAGARGVGSATSAVIYSEPITDASRYTSGPLSSQTSSGARSGAKPAGAARPG